METRINANLDLHQSVSISRLIEGLKINFSQIIVDELFIRTQKF